YACQWVGFGAKTAIGYGHLEPDTRALEAREEALSERREQQARDAEIAEQTAGLPNDAVWAEEQIQRGTWADKSGFLSSLEAWLEENQPEALSPQAWSRMTQTLESWDKGI